MKKKMISAFLIWLIACVLMFFIFSFANWNINPGNWAEGARFGYAVTISMMLIPCIIFRMMED